MPRSLRGRLILLFLVATIPPLGATLWFTSSLLERSLTYASTRELDEISHALERLGREYYRQARDSLRRDAAQGTIEPQRYLPGAEASWPAEVRAFQESGETERFVLSGANGDRLNFMTRRGGEVRVWSRPLGSVGMESLARQYRQARALVDAGNQRNLRRGFTLTLLLLALSVWLVGFALLAYLASRVSRPIRELTAALSELASGNLAVRVSVDREDEIGEAMHAFNRTAEELEQNRARLVYLAQLASWQALARKMAHELKNSLTPIRLTMEEVLARAGESDAAFIQQAAQIVGEEVETLERRVRAFSEFAAEPAVRPGVLDVNAVVAERVAFLRTGRPEVQYTLRLDPRLPAAHTDEDLVKGVLTNLLENAAEAAGAGGEVLGRTSLLNGKVAVEVHDSGPGLSEDVRRSLFEPAISFKKGGMGLGLSIARKSALLAGGDILLVKGELGGAAFRVVLPRYVAEQNPDR